MPSTEVIEIQPIEAEIITTEQHAYQIAVTSPESYQDAGSMLVRYKDLKKTIEAYFKPLKEAAHKSWKGICNRESEELDKLNPGIKYLTSQMTAYSLEQEKIRQAEEDRLRLEQQKRIEEEKLEAALLAEQAGAKEEAEAILTEEVFMPPPIVESVTPKVSGLGMATTWKWRLIDVNRIPREYLMVDTVKINGVVRAMKDKAEIPGIEVYPDSGIRGVRK